MSIVNLKIIFVKKQKQTRKRPTQGGGATFIITEMAVFTLQKDYSRETGYPLQIACVQPLPPPQKNRRRGVCGEGATVHRLVSDG